MTTSNVEELMSHFMAMIDAMNGVAPMILCNVAFTIDTCVGI